MMSKSIPQLYRSRETLFPRVSNCQDFEWLHCPAALWRLGFSRKRTVGAMERSEFLRVAWKVMVAERMEAWWLVLVDEMDNGYGHLAFCAVRLGFEGSEGALVGES